MKAIDDNIVFRALNLVLENGSVYVDDFAQLNGIDAALAEKLFLEISTIAKDDIEVEVSPLGCSSGDKAKGTKRFLLNPSVQSKENPLGHSGGAALRFSEREDKALREVFKSYSINENDYLFKKIFDAKGFIGAKTDNEQADVLEIEVLDEYTDKVMGDDASENANSGEGTGVNVRVSVSANAGAGAEFIPQSRGNIEILNRLCASIDYEEHLVLEAAYLKPDKANVEIKRIAPKMLVADGEVTMLQAWSMKDEDYPCKTYRTDRILELKKTNEKFDPKELPSIDSVKAQRVSLLFTNMKKVPDWPGIKVKKVREDGSIEATIPWYGSNWLVSHIVALGGKCITEDTKLQQRIFAYIERLQENTPNIKYAQHKH